MKIIYILMLYLVKLVVPKNKFIAVKELSLNDIDQKKNSRHSKY